VSRQWEFEVEFEPVVANSTRLEQVVMAMREETLSIGSADEGPRVRTVEGANESANGIGEAPNGRGRSDERAHRLGIAIDPGKPVVDGVRREGETSGGELGGPSVSSLEWWSRRTT
jgi:hypothetical protein